MSAIWLIVNCLFVPLFWNAHDIALAEDRQGWALTYLFISAANGAAILATIF
jgi:hypothetical protein